MVENSFDRTYYNGIFSAFLNLIMHVNVFDGQPPILRILEYVTGDMERRDEERTISPSVSIMKPILRFVQLLCENHNPHLQVS